jgi:hypothetical protein
VSNQANRERLGIARESFSLSLRLWHLEPITLGRRHFRDKFDRLSFQISMLFEPNRHDIANQRAFAALVIYRSLLDCPRQPIRNLKR